MKRIIGFACFFLGLGMFLGLIFAEGILGILLGCVCLILGYHLCCW